MASRFFTLLMSLALVGTLTAGARATDSNGDGTPPQPPKAEKPGGPPGKAPDKEKPEFPPFDEVMKDFTEVPTAETPFITLWYNKKKDVLRAQIPSGLLGQHFLIATSIAGGPIATGFQMDHYLAYLERMDKNLVLMEVDPRYVAGEGDQPLSDVIKRSYGNDFILRSIPIITLKGADPVIELDALFKADFMGIGEWGLGQVNPQLSKWSKYKSFPQNLELSVDQALMQRGYGQRMLFHYSISKIPESAKGYKPRVADDRVGYFMTVRKDWTKEHSEPTLFNRYVNRWKLEKRDSSAKLSAPKNPIIWYIEKTVPLKYRRWVKEGILEWNKAYEKCGFLDAIEVKQQEDYDPDTKNLDPEDVRYNFFRWIVTGSAFAMGPSRDHPLTGQIFDADIVFDDSMVRHYIIEYGRLTGNEESWDAYNPFLEAFFRAYPQWEYRSPWSRLLPGLKRSEDGEEQFRMNLMRHMYRRGRPLCECAAGMAHQLAFAGVALEAQGKGRDNEDFIGQVIKEVVMHEVGHCLGLRHNFKASTWLPMEEVEKQREAGEANVGSVMDYNPPIVAPRGKEQGAYTTRSIGPYDYWAIEYGYRPVGEPYKDEKEMLSKIASRVAEKGLDYGTDEDTFGVLSPDPNSNRFDMGSDVQEYAKRQMALTDSLLEDIATWAVKDGESYTRLRKAFMRIMSERARVCYFVARQVGGQVINRDHKADPEARPPMKPVDGKAQKKALKFVCKNVFAEDAFKVCPEVLSLLAPGRHWHWDSDEFDFRVEFNIHDFVLASQYRTLFALMNPFTVGRIHDNEVKFGDDDDVYALSEHLIGLSKAVWSELDDKDRKASKGKPFVNSFRRNLQREHLRLTLELVLSEPGGIVPADANAIARLTASRLSKAMGAALKSGSLDDATEAHFTDCKKRIDKALEANYTLNRFSLGGMGGMFFFRPAGEGGEAAPPVTVLPPR